MKIKTSLLPTLITCQLFAPEMFAPQTQRFHSKQYIPESQFLTDIKGPIAATDMNTEQTMEFAKSFLCSQYSIPAHDLAVTGHCDQSGTCYCYFTHLVDNKKVQNHNAQVTIAKGKVVALSINFDGHLDVKCVEKLDIADLISQKEREYGLALTLEPAKVWYQVSQTEMEPGVSFQLQGDGEHLSIVASTCTGETLELINFFNN
jgi:hypothetical protein